MAFATTQRIAGPGPRVGRRAFLAGAGASLCAFSSGHATAETPHTVPFPFDAKHARVLALSPQHPWAALRRRHQSQNTIALAAGTKADRWTHIVRGLAELPEPAICDALHGALRRVTYRTDISTYRRKDVWATPREFLQHGGDCEDFAAAAWLALAECGVSPANLRLVIGSLTDRRITHAVTAVQTGSQVTVLDNRFDRPVRTGLFDRLRPAYSLSQDRLWLHIGRTGAPVS